MKTSGDTVEGFPVRNRWAVAALGLSVFVVTTAEMMPVGLLPYLSADFAVSEGIAGLTVTLYGVVAGVFAPILTAVTRRIDRRSLIMLILSVFVTGNIVTALASNFVVLLVCRLAVGFVHGLLWSVMAAIAVRLVAPRYAVRATSFVFSGISLALVLGVPLGSVIGDRLDWRAAFWILVVLSAAALAMVAVAMPRMAPTGGVALREIPTLFAVTNLRIAVAVTALVVVANYAAYTYIAPYLIDDVGIDKVGALLLGYGIAGLAGNLVSGSIVARSESLRPVLAAYLAALSISLILLVASGSWTIAVCVLVIVWGGAYSAVPIALQTLVLRSAADRGEAATSLYVLVFNTSIAAGALFGGLAIDRAGASAPLILGAIVCLIALVVVGCCDLGRPTAAVGNGTPASVVDRKAQS
ncbi:MFS transporter [Gordonia rubripertincta]|uniref:MFS transporter n=1 Tax=Gordonia rubripertincta TaxID=36822 RepID=A0ABT4MT86_GORRU|nr:MFS transporter [Gordonia rubripertincta]MCZ4550229.1 MFS transporter [Gordonia rubripertincta]